MYALHFPFPQNRLYYTPNTPRKTSKPQEQSLLQARKFPFLDFPTASPALSIQLPSLPTNIPPKQRRLDPINTNQYSISRRKAHIQVGALPEQIGQRPARSKIPT